MGSSPHHAATCHVIYGMILKLGYFGWNKGKRVENGFMLYVGHHPHVFCCRKMMLEHWQTCSYQCKQTYYHLMHKEH